MLKKSSMTSLSKKAMLAISIFFMHMMSGCTSKNDISYKHPYDELKKTLEDQKEKTIRLFAYGSLMSPISRAKTLTHSMQDEGQMALAFGVKRIFSLDVHSKSFSSIEKHTAMLNVKKVNDKSAFINGILIEIDKDDLPYLAEREERYDLIPIEIVLWNNFLNGKLIFEKALILIRKQENSDPKDILPNINYLKKIEESIRPLGQCFFDLWQNTTFLADGKTSLKLWNKDE